MAYLWNNVERRKEENTEEKGRRFFKIIGLKKIKKRSKLTFSNRYFSDIFRPPLTDINFLYMNGIISGEHESETESYVKFSSPFVQKRLFNYFADEIFEYTDEFHDPFEPLDDAITEDSLNIRNIIKLYRKYQ
ncbi:hypothetical protein EPICR_130039 [Candidatus Desulfarcum epimagneticum]|uniref:Uncharacterized protein n=1 Tax=uncultured Desulfobacteraceae bacterium TaxID=218296 RepID=A0A484HHT2_9BACT|nr:hypothetical protein EPICR_130039 [uncultured Desulfobacteraceae bacterium]